MTKQEARAWVQENAEAAKDIATAIARWKQAITYSMSDIRCDRLASYFEDRAIEIYMDNGGNDDFAAVHMIGTAYREARQSEQVATN